MKLRVSTNKEALQENTGGNNYLNKSGVYDVKINFASLSTSRNGAVSVNFNFDYNGNSQTIYGPYIFKKDGSLNESGYKIINALATIVGLKDGDELTIENEVHKVGKDNTEQEFEVITDFTDAEVKVWLQEEYSINPNTNEIQKRMNIKRFYSADGATAEELTIGEKPAGTNLKYVLDNLADKVTYKDGVTPEQVEEWKKSKSKDASTPKVKVAKKSSSPFG